jgi:aryl-alcohol dehydrogenase-like predicted oxidoreductase
MPSRAFGSTGRRVSVFGLGSFYVGAAASDEEGKSVVLRALDLGCTYVDTAPSYVRGASERRVGLALAGRRDSVFLATKTLERTRAGAKADLDASLKRLRTDHVDLVQVHCVRTAEDLDGVLAKDGPLEALLEAKEKGKVRFVGVTGHEDPAVMRAAIERWPWDSVLLPLNPVDPHRRSFLEGALPAAVARKTARVAMKVFASGRLVAPGALAAEECLRFAYGLDVSCAIVGCATVEEVEVAARVAREASTLTEEERGALVARAKPFAGTPPRGVEWYKRD